MKEVLDGERGTTQETITKKKKKTGKGEAIFGRLGLLGGASCKVQKARGGKTLTGGEEWVDFSRGRRP